MWRSRQWLCGLAVLTSCAAGASPQEGVRDLYFGEALYHTYQGEYFDAIARLDTELGQYYLIDEPELDSLHLHINEAEFSVGDFELSYRMHNRAGRAIKAVIEGNVSAEVRNEAAYRLARLYLSKGQPIDALHALERIKGAIPERLRDDLDFLRAQVYMENGRPTDAITILKPLQDAKGLEGFSAYNLGIASIQAGQIVEGGLQLAKAGQAGGDAPETQAIRDKSNLVLGTQLLQNKKFELAKQYLDLVHLKGPFSNRALLSSGWADVSLGRYDRALVPWTILAKRNATDAAVQEALLAVPYAYSNLNIHGKAALLYGNALDLFDRELGKLDASIRSIREGKFLTALGREELKQDKNWVIKLRELPESPETHYLIELLASHDFQESLKNYLDLEELRKKLAAWDEGIHSYEEIIALRRKYYEPLLPDIDRQFRLLDSKIKLRLEQRQHLENRLQSMLVSRRQDFLATADERILLERLARIEAKARSDASPGADDLRRRLARLNGVLQWRIMTEYDQRLTEAYTHLRELDADVKKLTTRYDAFVRTRQAATQSYQGYDGQIMKLRMRVRDSSQKVETLMARQGHMLEVMAVNELDVRRKRLEEFQMQARFAMAESYDRAMNVPPPESGKPK